MTFQISLHVTLKKYLSSLLSFFQFLLMKNFLFVMKIDREQSIFRQQGTEDSPFIEATTLLALPKATKQTIYHDLGEPCKKKDNFPLLTKLLWSLHFGQGLIGRGLVVALATQRQYNSKSRRMRICTFFYENYYCAVSDIESFTIEYLIKVRSAKSK